VHPTSAILVSDGADDEAITPLITSRVKIDAIKRVTVRQSQNIESTYYILRRWLADERMRMSFLVPLALALLVFGFFTIIGRYEIGVGAIFLVLAAYLLAKVFHLEVALQRVWAGLRETFVPGRVTLVSTSVTVLLLVVGSVYAYTSLGSGLVARRAIDFARSLVWFVVGGALVYVAGKAIDVYLRREEICWSYLPLSLFIVATGLFASAALTIATRLIDHVFPLNGVSTLFLLIGLLVAIVGGSTYVSLRKKRVIEVEAEQSNT
jgi:putative membrane protein